MKIFKKLSIVIITFVLLLVTLGSTTLAWISLSTVNNVEGLSLTATTGEELEISLDGINYSNNISAEQLHEMFEDIRLKSVTSVDGINFEAGGLQFFQNVYANEDYMQFDIWFQTTENVHDVYLVNNISDDVAYNNQSNGTYVISRGVEWTSKETFQYGPNQYVNEGDTNTYYSSDAVRLSFNEQHNEYNELDQRSSVELTHWIFDPSGDQTRGYGERYGAYSYFVERTRYHITIPSAKPGVMYELSELNPRNPYEVLSNSSKVATLQDTGIVNQDGLPIYQGKLRVSIWIEGWDADAFDAIDGDTLKIQLQFKLAKLAESNMD